MTELASAGTRRNGSALSPTAGGATGPSSYSSACELRADRCHCCDVHRGSGQNVGRPAHAHPGPRHHNAATRLSAANAGFRTTNGSADGGSLTPPAITPSDANGPPRLSRRVRNTFAAP